MHVICLVKRPSHHTDSGGYYRLAAALNAQVIMQKQVSGLFGKIANKVWWHLIGKSYQTLDYQFGDWLAEVHALAIGFFRPPDVLHVFYGSQINLLVRWRKLLRCPLVVTFHDYSRDNLRRFDAPSKGLDIDVAVVVAKSQKTLMQHRIEERKIVYVPHGIDTDRFRPNGQPLDPDKMHLVIVGEHMRDWLVIHRTIDEINHLGLNIEFHVLTNERLFPYLNGCANLVYHSQISEEELIELYCGADALFVPVTNATANNSVLEALACGTPVISTSIGGLPDYVTDDCGWLLPLGDVSGHVDLIVSLYGERELAHSRRLAARNQASKFDWRLIAEQMVAVYAATGVRE